MGLDALLAKLQREAVTPVTPSIALGVAAEALPLLGVPPVSPVPPEDKDGQPFYAGWWLLHFSDRDPLEVAFSPAATHAEVLDAYPDAAAAEPIEAGRRQPDTLLAGNQEAAVSAWLAQIGETDPATIAEVLTACRRDADARDYFTGRAAAELPKPSPYPDDRRTCDQCANLIAGRCQAAKRGEIVASWDYKPIRDIPRRCEGYAARAGDSDRRDGRERWPGLAKEGND